MKPREIRPYPGAQTRFLSTSADVGLYGGTAGSGKSMVSLMESARHVNNPAFRAVYFRRTSADLRKPKGLWDTSHQIYPHLGGVARDALLEWRFPSGAWIKMNHLERESDIHDHQGSEYGLIVMDEAPHFSSSAFWYLRSRNRAPLEAGIRAYWRGNANPDPDSWVMTEFLDPGGYIDEEGYPRPEMSGVLRYFVRDPDRETLAWADSVAELVELAPHIFARFPTIAPHELAKSFTFVPAKLSDNPSMGPDYEATLASMPLVDRMRLLYGNWRVREAAGTVFREEWFVAVDHAGPAHARRVRYWDLAGSKRRRSDFTAGVLMSQMPGETPIIEDVINEKMSAGEVKALIIATAITDGSSVEVWVEEEKGAAGQIVVAEIAAALQGFTVRPNPVVDDKLVRAKPLSSTAQLGAQNGTPVRYVRATKWNRPYLAQMQAFDGRGKVHDDMVDATVGAYHALQQPPFSWASATW